MAGGGFVLLYRSIEHKSWYKKNAYRGAFLDLFLNVNYEDKIVSLGGTTVLCKRGQVCKSQHTWAKRWEMERRTAAKFLETLAEDGTITIDIIKGKTTLITMPNFDALQKALYGGETEGHPPAKKTRRRKPEGDKPPQEPKGAPSIDQVKEYFSENGYTEAAAAKFFEHYTRTGWVDKNQNPVKNWKGKAQKVWFRDEHKKPAPDDCDIEGTPINRMIHPDFPREYPYTQGNIYKHEKGMNLNTRQEIESWSK